VTEGEWGDRARRLLKAELARAELSYEELAARLTKDGMPETKSGIASKISRGTFSAAFLLAALRAAGCSGIRLEDV
jgi:hypothetical protein